MTDRATIQTRVKALPTDIQDIIYRFEHNLSFRECLDDIENRLRDLMFLGYNNVREFRPNKNVMESRKPSHSYIIKKILNIKQALIEPVEVAHCGRNASATHYQIATDTSNKARVHSVTMYEMICYHYDYYAQYALNIAYDRDERERNTYYSDRTYREPGEDRIFGVLAFRTDSDFKEYRGNDFQVLDEYCLRND